MKHTIPTSLRRTEERYAARQMADALLRADARKQRAVAMPKLTKKAAPTSVAGPQPIRLADLKRAIAAKHRAGGLRHRDGAGTSGAGEEAQ